MAPVPLLLPSVVAIVIGTGLGALVAPRVARAPSAFVAPLGGVVPALMTWVVLGAPLGELYRAPLVLVGGFLQVGVVVAIAVLRIRAASRWSVTIAGLASALAVVMLVAGVLRARAAGTRWAPEDCAEATVQGGAPSFERDGVTIVGSYVGPQTPQHWGPFTCVAEIATVGGATRRQTLIGSPTQLSGSIFCPGVDVLSCPRAQILVLQGSAYRTKDLTPTSPTFAGNLSAFGPPPWYLALAFAAACGALLLCLGAVNCLPPRVLAVRATGAHPYRDPTLDARGTREELRVIRLGFVAVVIALAGAAPLATTFVVG